MKPITLLTATVFSLTFGLAHAGNIEGDYSVKGKDVNGVAYQGKLTVSANGPVFKMTYKDGRTIRGMGIQRGDHLFAAWGPSDKCTVSALDILPDGNMEGPWADLSHAKLGTEKLKRQSGTKADVTGTFASSGMDTDGSPYEGITTIEARGAIYKVTFKSPDETSNGVGVKLGSSLAVSYGGNKCGVTVYTIKPDNTMVGVYAEYGASKTGSEEMVKGW